MIIISDCLTEKTDEGCIKVANSLAYKIKKADPKSVLISYGPKNCKSDVHLKLNKCFLNWNLWKLIADKKDTVLFIPFASNTFGSAVRLYVLSKRTKNLKVIFCLRHSMNRITINLLMRSGAEILALSKESYDYYNNLVNRVKYIKTGVDTEKFCPVTLEEKNRLRIKYNIDPAKKVVLHVGHMKDGRNVNKLLNIPEDYQVLLVVSSVTEKDAALEKKLSYKSNITIISDYIANIEELYQLSDLYFFPVTEAANCIDIPLSVLEAASCNIPVATTPYGEIKELIDKKGFYRIESFESSALDSLFSTILSSSKECDIRKWVLEYDWEESLMKIL